MEVIEVPPYVSDEEEDMNDALIFSSTVSIEGMANSEREAICWIWRQSFNRVFIEFQAVKALGLSLCVYRKLKRADSHFART